MYFVLDNDNAACRKISRHFRWVKNNFIFIFPVEVQTDMCWSAINQDKNSFWAGLLGRNLTFYNKNPLVSHGSMHISLKQWYTCTKETTIHQLSFCFL